MSAAGAAENFEAMPAGDPPPGDASSVDLPTPGVGPDLALAPDSNNAADPASSPADSSVAAPAPSSASGPGETASAEPDKVIRYDFRHPALVAPREMRKLRLRHEEFVRSLATRLSINLRMEFGLTLQTLDTRPFRGFIDSLPNPSHFTLFKTDSLDGIGLLEIPTVVGLTIVDRLMGGPGKPVSLGRDLTEIETALLDQAVLVMLREWNQHVHRQNESNPTLLGHENNGRFLQFVSNDTNMVVLAMQVSLGDLKDTLHLAFTYETLEPLIHQLGPLIEASKKPSAPPPSSAPIWNPALGSLTVPVVAQWSGLKISLRQLTELKVGDVLPVEARYGQQVQVQMAKISKFTGRLGTCGKAWAVELTGPIKR